uniref:Diphosphoinositol polyphosphate phosphohydrolase n=1 Tax=Rhizophora mucronata TaxID=61149 RepID=A0A2P2JBE4_RHIMU
MCHVFCSRSSIYPVLPEHFREPQPLQVIPWMLLLQQIHQVPNHPGKPQLLAC